MATYVERDGAVLVRVRLRGVSATKTFPNKTKAKEWATKKEASILDKTTGVVQAITFATLLEEYREKLDPITQRSDRTRISTFIRTQAMAKVSLRELDKTHVATWRDGRLKHVEPGSVLREWNTLSAACKWAVRDKHYMNVNPFKGASRPPEPPHRDRRPSLEEIKDIRRVTGYTNDSTLPTQLERICAAFLFAIETGMRVGEIFVLKPQHIHLKQFYALVEGQTVGREVGGGKTASTRRQVPLSAEAERIVRQLIDHPNGTRLFGLNSKASAEVMWRTKIMSKAGITDLHFHDSRHEACSRLASKIPLLDLARMMGIKDLSTLNVYYNPTATEIASRLRT